MGYFIKNLNQIATVTEPAQFTLSCNPAFTKIEALPEEGEFSEFRLTVTGIVYNYSEFQIKILDQEEKYYFMALSDPTLFDDDEHTFIYIISDDLNVMAQNIAAAFGNNNYLSTNFDIKVKNNVVRIIARNKNINISSLIEYKAINMGAGAEFEGKFFYNHIDVELNIVGGGFAAMDESKPSDLTNITGFTIVERKTGISHIFEGTDDISRIGGGTFYLGSNSKLNPSEQDKIIIAENLKSCLQANDFLGRNFDISVPLVKNSEGEINKGTTVKIISKGTTADYAFTLTPNIENEYKKFFSQCFMTVKGETKNIGSNDSISQGHSPVEVQLELYKHTGVFPGMNSAPDEVNVGTLVTTLSKAYSNSSLWFNTNILQSKNYSKDFLDEGNKWFDTGTVRDYRFAVKRFVSSKEFYENSLFYYSNVFYTVNGYQRTLENNDLSAYVYDTSKSTKAKPLTTQPQLFHIKGQVQYFNFLLSDAQHNDEEGGNLAITYHILSQSGRSLGEKVLHALPKHKFYAVNSIRLDVDAATSEYPNAGQVEVYLSRLLPDAEKYIKVSEPLKFVILPHCLYKVHDFAFLNSLGGWSSFNFGGTDQSEFKANTNTIFKTHTPDKTVSGELESVFSKDVEEQLSVQTMPITREVAEWLRELSVSKAVYEVSTKRYVIVDELAIKPNSKDDLFRLDMKYRYSDTFNAK